MADENGNARSTQSGTLIHPVPYLHRYSKYPLSLAAEGVYVIPSAPCAICDCSGGAFFQAEQHVKLVWQYPLSDFTGLGGNVILTSEHGTTSQTPLS